MIKPILISVFAVLLCATMNAVFSQIPQDRSDELAQRLQTLASMSNRTSVYVSTSKNVYISGEDAWFNAFILNSADFTLSTLDQTLYLQVQRKSNDSIVWQEMYPINQGTAAGHIYLPPNLPADDYLVKAYTAHSYFFNQSYFYAIAAIRVVKDPRDIVIPRPATSQIEPPTKSTIQFNVFPEGGNLVAGLPSRVGFKAVDTTGHAMTVNGTLFKNNVPVITFSSLHAGMGSFVFTPETNNVYHIVLEGHRDTMYLMPKVTSGGVTIQLIENKMGKLTFKTFASTSEINKMFFLRLQIRGTVQSVAGLRLKDRMLITIPVADSVHGLAEVTFFDEQLRPFAERLVFINNNRELKINFIANKSRYSGKEKVTLHIKTTNQIGMPTSAALSVRAYDNLFQDRSNTRNIVNYYFLSTQLRGKVDDPSYYFDTAHTDRTAALDLLLLCQGWRRYTWNEEEMNKSPIGEKRMLTDTLQARLIPRRSRLKEAQPVPLLFCNYNKSANQLAVTDSSGHFFYSSHQLGLGRRFFVSYFSKNEYKFYVPNLFDTITAQEAIQKPEYVVSEKFLEALKETRDTSDLIQYGSLLESVTITAKGRGFSDPYLGYLDSIAKFEGNTDYVCRLNGGYLNCPWCHFGTNKPVEGQKYWLFIAKRKPVGHFVDPEFTSDEVTQIEYHYPKFTEEDLLKKFKMAIVKGYYTGREFYEPNYDKDSKTNADNRNTILWKPLIITASNGEATIEFYCSDVRGRFSITIEGVGGDGLVGFSTLNFNVK